ncbi:MAG: hypothetical protein IKC02_06900 [Oscillospiraceae bacterium]|nr:hypothetical protein [Oscillospiraceae bacterium]
MKKLFAILLVAAMLFSLAACGTTNSGSGDKTLLENGRFSNVTVAVSSEIQNLLPTNGNGNPKAAFYWNIYESLFDFNEDLELVPDLAKSYEVVDSTHWQVHLFETIYDSAGNHITAEDVVASVEWLRTAGEDLNYDIFESITMVDEYTVEYTWTETPTSTSDIEFPFVRTFIFDKDAFDEVTFATAPIGTGNYVVDSFITGSEMVLKANENYWAANTAEDVSMRLALHNATVEKLTYRIIQESSTAEIELEMGNIDYCDYIRYLSLDKFEGNPEFVVDVSYASDYSFMGFNMDPASPFAQDQNLRLAVAYALDSDSIAEAMPGSYTAMYTYGTPYFKDYDSAWEADPSYCNTFDLELAKDYLAKSDYAANGSPMITVICKSAESDKNAVQMIVSQLAALGINVEMKAVDPATFQTDTMNSANWDLLFFNPMGGKDLASSWKLALADLGNPRTDGDTGSLIFHNDDTLFELYDVATADATHTTENMKAVIDYVFEQAYIYPVAYSVSARIYRADTISGIYYREGYDTLPASTYVGQTENKDPAGGGIPLAIGGDASAIVGSYTFSEVVGEGSGSCEYKVTFNEDGTYRIDQHNMYGEDVWIEGSYAYVDGVVICEAPEAGVQGPMDRLLNSGWANVDAPATSWVLNGDGTVTPVGYEAPEGGKEEAPAEDEVPGIVNALTGNMGFEAFKYYEETEEGWIEWYVMIKPETEGEVETGECILVSVNEAGGTEDGLLVYHCTYSKEKANISASVPEETEADQPRLGSVFNADGSSNWTIFGPGNIASDNVADMDAYKAGVNDGSIPSKPEPGILKGLAGMGFDRFDYMEETPYGVFPWHVLIKNGDPTPEGLEAGECIIVVENPNMGTADGLLVYHCTFTKDKATINVSCPDETDEEMKRLGNMWNADGTSVWTISGKGVIAPEPASDAPAAEPEAPAEPEEPGILGALANMGFDRFDYMEETPFGTFPWHVFIKNGDPTPEGLEAGECIIVVENPNLGTADGLLVYHCTFTKDKAVINVSCPEETDEEMKRLGDMWNSDGTSVWVISGKGVIAPEPASK